MRFNQPSDAVSTKADKKIYLDIRMLKNQFLTDEKSSLSSKYKNKNGGRRMFKYSEQTSKGNSANSLSWHKDTQRENEEYSLWNEILFQFRALPRERQDEILMRIYKKVYGNTAKARKLSYISSGKC